MFHVQYPHAESLMIFRIRYLGKYYAYIGYSVNESGFAIFVGKLIRYCISLTFPVWTVVVKTPLANISFSVNCYKPNLQFSQKGILNTLCKNTG